MTADLELVVIVVQHKDEKKVVDAVLAAGAGGVTYFYGQGTGVRQRLGFLGNFIQAEKVVLLTAVSSAKTAAVLAAATQAAALDKPGHGFACVLKITQALGLV